MELSRAHLRYLYTIYEISKRTPDVSSASISKCLRVSRPSVSRMLGALMKENLLVKKRYGKIYLTDKGFLLARDFDRKVCCLKRCIPRMCLPLSEGETAEAACVLAAVFLEKALNFPRDEAQGTQRQVSKS